MSIKQEYEDYAARREALAKTHFGPIWLNPLDRYVHPFRIWEKARSNEPQNKKL